MQLLWSISEQRKGDPHVASLPRIKMIKPLELFIGLRYTRAKRRNNFISLISLLSIICVALGVWALITVMSVMNGFEKELRERLLGIASHITISKYDPFEDWPMIEQQTKEIEDVVGAAPFIEGQGMLARGNQVNGSIIRGVLPDKEISVTEVLEKLIEGQADSLVEGEFNIIVGSALAAKLGIGLGSKVTVISPQGQVTPAGLIPRLKRFNVTGIFDLGVHEYDSGLALIHLKDAAKLFRKVNTIDGLRLKLDDVFLAPQITGDLQHELGFDYRVTDWTNAYSSFFRALKTERRVMFVILSIIILIAAFNIVSTLVMVVTEKQSDIAILKTFGSTPSSILKIFMVQGTVIGLVGTIIGAILGVLTALNVSELVGWIEGVFNTEFMPADLYLISGFPSELLVSDVIKVTAVAFVLSLLATLYPAWNASRVQPAEALRYE